MASKRDIKAAIRNEAVIACDTLVPPERVLYTTQETRIEEYPRVTYSVYEVPAKYNNGSKPQPYKYLFQNGEKVAAIYATFYTLHVDILVKGDSAASDAIYDALKAQFVPYTLWKDDSDLHPDVTEIDMDGSSESVTTKTEPSVFDTMLQLVIEYRQDVTREGKPIKNIYHHFDVDHDGSTDVTYITDASNSP